MLSEDFDPYQEIIDLKTGIAHHVNLINQLLHNEKQFITAINKASERIDELELRILKIEMQQTDLEEEPNEITRKKR